MGASIPRTLASLTVLAALVAPSIARAVPSDDARSIARSASAESEDVLDLVDPFIGTMGSGFVFPGPAAPFGMIQPSPDTDGPTAFTGYAYQDRRIRGFSHVHTQSMGVWSSGEVPVMPIAGEPSSDVKAYQSTYDKASERAEVGSYAVRLDNGVEVELTAGLRTALHRYRFPAGAPATIVVDAGRTVADAALIGPDLQNDPGVVAAQIEHRPDGITVGTVRSDEPAGTREYTVHFAIATSEPAGERGGAEARGAPATPRDEVSGLGASGYLRFDPIDEPRDVLVAVGISFVDRAGAIGNLLADADAAGFDFESMRERTRAAWRDALSTIEVAGGLHADRVSFATALYHAQHHPNVFTDADGRYRGMDRQAHRIGDPGDPMPSGTTYYANFSMWDTYRTQMPLLSWIQPARYRDMLRSLHAASVQGGRLPHWGWMDRYADFMNGNPALPVIADGICRGLVDPALAADLYRDARRMALANPEQAHRDPVYLQRGYVPADHHGGSFGSGASSTLEYATNDFSLALVADALGHADDRDALIAQSGNWRNVFDPQTRFMRPRNADGGFVGNPYVPGGPYLPELPDGWREGTGWQYTWLVPHDPAALFAAIGDDVESRMDVFFSLPGLLAAPHATTELQQKLTLYGIAYAGNQYAPSNEHDLQAPWLYAHGETPWKTDAAVSAYRTLYRPTPDGLPGNDDLGTMSAWFVFAALGLYPVQAGAPVYTLTAPLFERAIVTPVDGAAPTTIEAPGVVSTTIDAPGVALAQRFVASATIDDVPVTRRSIAERALHGATLRVERAAAPPAGASLSAALSASTDGLDGFDCHAQ